MYALYIVKRTQIYLDDGQDTALSRRAGAAGVTKSKLIREAIDAYLAGPGDEHARLAAFRAALDEAARRPLHLEAGAEFVERIRAADLRRQRELERRRG